MWSFAGTFQKVPFGESLMELCLSICLIDPKRLMRLSSIKLVCPKGVMIFSLDFSFFMQMGLVTGRT
jgi:hypothetical protein